MEQNRPYVLALDVGTSSLKAVVYAPSGTVLAAATQRYDYTSPQPGWGEIDPELWWQALVAALAELRPQVDLHQAQVVAVTGQMHTAVLLDAERRPLRPVILWLDRRASAETEELQGALKLPPYHLNSTYTLPKLLWLARHVPQVAAQARYLLWPKDYLRFRLTGQIFTDRTEAGGAALLDWETETWAEERLERVGFSPEILPPLRRFTDDAGPLRTDVAQQLGLSPQARVIIGAGDVLALVTAAPPVAGRVTCSLGTSSMVFTPLAEGQWVEDPQRRLYSYPLLPYPLLGGVSSTTGASLQWLWRAVFAEAIPFEQMLATAQPIPAGADGLFFLPYLSGERSPYWDDGLRGAFYGFTMTHSRAHMVRAVMEGVAFSLRYLLQIYGELGVKITEIALAGGGAGTPGWPQIIADACQLPVLVYSGQETVTRGLYAFACLALGDAASFGEALARTFGAGEMVDADPAQAVLYDRIFRRYRALSDFAHQSLSALDQVGVL